MTTTTHRPSSTATRASDGKYNRQDIVLRHRGRCQASTLSLSSSMSPMPWKFISSWQVEQVTRSHGSPGPSVFRVKIIPPSPQRTRALMFSTWCAYRSSWQRLRDQVDEVATAAVLPYRIRRIQFLMAHSGSPEDPRTSRCRAAGITCGIVGLRALGGAEAHRRTPTAMCRCAARCPLHGPVASGHCYLRLKTTGGAGKRDLDGVWAACGSSPEGLDVVVSGKLTTFASSSNDQIVIDTLEPASVGALMNLLEERQSSSLPRACSTNAQAAHSVFARA